MSEINHPNEEQIREKTNLERKSVNETIKDKEKADLPSGRSQEEEEEVLESKQTGLSS